MPNTIPLKFDVGHTKNKGDPPKKSVPASVPGNAQLDWVRAESYPDYNFSDNFKLFDWMEDVYWVYSAKIERPETKEGERVYFISKGIDYEFEILLDGCELLHQEGMFTPVSLDITDMLAETSSIDVVIYPAPKAKNREKDRSEADESAKPPVSYGWDWHPRLIPSGLYEECWLEVRPKSHIVDAELRYALSEDLSFADLTLQVELSAPGTIRWELFDDEGSLVCKYTFDFDGCDCADQISQKQLKFYYPKLWWPNEHGKQTLYKSVFTLLDKEGGAIDSKESKVGFRHCKLVSNPGAETPGFPFSGNYPPITLEINNRRIFCKGSNWVEPEIFTGTITKKSYEPLVRL
ncbi:MAG: hypothetical protein FWH48_10480, partial [Oscillospiraceae bacterium]|nr:hypothetical protein [Oscillospiraceae bacterium]